MRRTSKEDKKLEKEKKREEKKEEKEKKKKGRRRSSALSEGEEDLEKVKKAEGNAPREGPTGEGPPPEKGKSRASAFDVDPADPAANKAATKIQATYRGHNARRSLRASMAGKQSEGDSPTKQQLEKDFDPNDTGSSTSSSSSTNSASSDETIVSNKRSEIIPPNNWYDSVAGELEKIIVVGIGAALVSLFFFSFGERNKT